jgi:hypothetical protein
MQTMHLPGFERLDPATPSPADPDERRRQHLLARSDRLLDAVEELRLRDEVETPPGLRERIMELRRLAGVPGRRLPDRLELAHNQLLGVQDTLLTLDPRHPRVRGGGGRSAATGEVWKHLNLPPIPASGRDQRWRELARAIVERAFDRWCWAQHHATRAARAGQDARAALRRANAAWTNYYTLRSEAMRLGAWLCLEPAGAPPNGDVPADEDVVAARNQVAGL